MKDRTLYGLIGAAIVLLLISYVLHSHVQSRKVAFVAGSELLSGFDIDQVSRITIQDPKSKVTLVKDKDQFVLEEKSRYPASNARVNDFFKTCSSITLDEKVTDNPDKHEALGVKMAEEGVGEESAFVTLEDRTGKKLAEFIVGKRKEKPMGRYVRLTDKPEVYFTKSGVALMTDYKHYIERNLLDLAGEEIEKVVVNPGGTSYTITADEEGQPALETIPAGKKVKGTAYKQVFRALSPLHYSDFFLASAPEVSGLVFDRTYTAHLRDKRLYKLSIAGKDEDYYIKILAAADLPTRVTVSKDETEEELKKKDEILQIHETVKKFNELGASWVFKMDKYVGEKFTMKLDELVE